MLIVIRNKATQDIIEAYINVSTITAKKMVLSDGSIIGNLNRNNSEFLQMLKDPSWQSEADYRNPIVDPDSNEVVGYEGLNDSALTWINNEITAGNYNTV